MNSIQHKELISLLSRHAQTDGTTKTPIPGVSLFKASVKESPVPSVYNPCLCIIAQGDKDVALDKEKYHYGPLQYLAVSVDLPLMNKITKASKDKPYLLIKIDIDTKQLSDLLIDARLANPVSFKTRRGIFIGQVDDEMGDAVVRLARLLNNPEQIPVLAYQTLKEIYYRVLLSKHGEIFSQIALKASPVHNIAKAIVHLKNNFRERLLIKDLANVAGMSASAFHSHFKLVTAMSPLQYQKMLRLIEARSLILNGDTDIASAGYKVGYQSASQFSREYARMFGNPPKKDIAAFRRKVKPK